jgi:hypothetical protein
VVQCPVVLPQLPKLEQQSPNVLPVQVCPLEPPQLPSVEILLLPVGHVPKEAWQPAEQNAVVLPQYPEAEQQSPKALPLQV